MTTITSFSSIQEAAARGAALSRTPQTKFDINAKEYGAAAATVLAAADAVSNTVSTVCSISEKGLSELARIPQDIYSGATELAQDMASTVVDAADTVGEAVEATAQDLMSFSRQGLRQVGQVALGVAAVANDGLQTASTVNNAVANAAGQVGNAAATVAGYTGLGVAAALQHFTDLG